MSGELEWRWIQKLSSTADTAFSSPSASKPTPPSPLTTTGNSSRWWTWVWGRWTTWINWEIIAWKNEILFLGQTFVFEKLPLLMIKNRTQIFWNNLFYFLCYFKDEIIRRFFCYSVREIIRRKWVICCVNINWLDSRNSPQTSFTSSIRFPYSDELLTKFFHGLDIHLVNFRNFWQMFRSWEFVNGGKGYNFIKNVLFYSSFMIFIFRKYQFLHFIGAVFKVYPFALYQISLDKIKLRISHTSSFSLSKGYKKSNISKSV